MKTKLILSLLLFASLFTACSTDLDVTGDWKETMVIYGLLDQSQDTQYVKINKAFLGQGNAYEYAQIKDSVQFLNSLTVQLQRIKNGISLGAPIQLMPTPNVPKDAGTFYYADQTYAIYSYVSTGANALNPDSQYELSVLNNETGTKASSKTSLVGNFNITIPMPSSPSFYIINAGPTSQTWPFTVKWQAAVNGKLYQMNMRFNYEEFIDTNGDTIPEYSVVKHLDWLFPAQESLNLTGTEVMSLSFPSQNFMKHIGTSIGSTLNVVRRQALKTDLIITAGTDDLNTFINVNEPSTGIIQDKPEFTNITNGLGLFSSRVTSVMSRDLEATTKDTLACGQYTRGLKFTNSVGIVPNCH